MKPSFSHAWRALKHRNFKLFFMGQGISVIGTWMTRMASSWLVYRLSGSPLLLGVVTFAGQIIPFVLQPLTGAWVERHDKHKVLIWTQAAAGLQSFVLALLTLFNLINIWEIIALSALQGLINAFDTPARQAFLVQMVEDKKDLGNAIALNSTMVNGARLLGPALAGVAIGIVGEGGCFMIDSVSYIAVIASLLAMQLAPRKKREGKGNIFAEMLEGWDYVRTFVPIRTLLLFLWAISLTAFPYMVLMPVFAVKVFGGGPTTLGWLTAASGLGALSSAISLAFRKTVLGLTRMIQLSALMLGAAIILLGFTDKIIFALPLMVIAGFGMMQCVAASNTIIQTIVPEDKRARVMGYYAMTFFGAAPIGSLIAGGVAQRIGVQDTVIIMGSLCLLCCAWFAMQMPAVKTIMRPIYQELGILPQ